MADRAGAPARAWQRMLSGRRLDLLDPSPLDIELEDIAHGLARVARWNGQTLGPHAFSVAQHSILVEAIMVHLKPDLSAQDRLAGLLHDAPEYVIGDMISPFKRMIGDGYRDVEARLQSAVHIRFGLPARLPATLTKAIKRADQICAYHEATRLAGFGAQEAKTYFGKPNGPEPVTLDLTPWPVETAQARFAQRVETMAGEAGS